MFIVKKELSYIENKTLSLIPSNYIFFDIETTGLKKETRLVYLIGCIYFKDNTWNFIQFFNDDGNSEEEIIHNFFSLLYSDTCLVHYNGIRFDVPYIDYKRKLYKFKTNLYNFSQLDLYCEFSKLKNILMLDGRKQKDLERFFGLSRKDQLSGGELIHVYQSYLKTQNQKLLSLLLLHNEDDILGLLSLLIYFLPYSKLNNGKFTIKNLTKTTDTLTVFFSIPLALPREFRKKKEGIYFKIEKKSGIFSLPILRQELKFFYPNYRDYYYLPAEDYAIHKSIAQFVEKDYRKKATAKTCYQKKEGEFLPICKTFPKESLAPLEQFRTEYSDKQIYIEYKKELPVDFWKLYINSYYLSLL